MAVWLRSKNFLSNLSTSLLVPLTVCISGVLHAQELVIGEPFVLNDGQSRFFDSVYADVAEETNAFKRSVSQQTTFDLVSQATPVPAPPSSTAPAPAASSASVQPGSTARNSPNTPTPQVNVRPQTSANNRTARSPQSPYARQSPSSRRPVRLARAPNMFGDFWGGAPSLEYATPVIDYSNSGPIVHAFADGAVQSPMAFGGRRLKVFENNNVLPLHRFYVNYNHYHNAVDSTYDDGVSADRDRSSIDIWTLGLERPFGQNDQWSVEFRLPIYESTSSGASIDKPAFFDNVDYAVGDSGVGNLGVILKRILYQSESTTVSGGLGLNLPTAEDVSVRVRRVTTEFSNETVDMTPWLGISSGTRQGWFWQFVTQLNVPLNGNDVNFSLGVDPNNVAGSSPGSGSFGKYNLQTFMTVDLSSGYWLYRKPGTGGITGVAAIAELHYTSTLNDTDIVTGDTGALTDVAGSDTGFELSQSGNRLDILNLTLGVHAAINDNITVRFGQVIPLRDGFDRPASTESQVQVNIVL